MIEVRLLNKGYKNNSEIYKDFLEGKIKNKDEYFSEKVVLLNEIPDFPVYIVDKNKREEDFFEAFKIIADSYINIDREIYMDEVFWHSLLCTYKRDYLLEKYPEIKESERDFKNIVLKKFDWENYIYKSVLAVQYVIDRVVSREERERYFKLIIENLDLYNYIIKYEIFRNDNFLINVLDILDECNLSKILKAKIKGRSDLGSDERYGRRVIFEFNKSYPIVMSPMLEKDELKKIFLEYLGYYYDMSKLEL